MSSTYSEPVTVTASLQGVWLHDPDDPEGTAHNFLYGRSRRSGSLEVEAEDGRYAGRTFPVVDFGPYEQELVSVEAHAVDGTDVAALYRFVRLRKPLYYRDNRGRAMLARLSGAADRDEDFGTSLSFSVSRVEG